MTEEERKNIGMLKADGKGTRSESATGVASEHRKQTLAPSVASAMASGSSIGLGGGGSGRRANDFGDMPSTSNNDYLRQSLAYINQGSGVDKNAVAQRIQEFQGFLTRGHTLDYEPGLDRDILRTENDNHYVASTPPVPPSNFVYLHENLERTFARVAQYPREHWADQNTGGTLVHAAPIAPVRVLKMFFDFLFFSRSFQTQ